MNRRTFLSSALTPALTYALAPAAAPAPYGAVPSPRQLGWHSMETYAFLHFTINTFTDKEWGYGDEDPNLFNPVEFDAAQMVEALAAAGMKGVILTCKHHDGFCLWPTKTTSHSVGSIRWRNGKGDVVRDVSEAARKRGLKFGVYLSPWDRNTALYAGPKYVDMYRAQLRELLTQYGPIFEVWHDGANGGDGFYGGARERRKIDKRTYYDWPRTWELVRSLQPNAVIFSDVGPDIRWVGNEKGFAGETCWATVTPVGEDGGEASVGNVRQRDNQTGYRNGAKWIPAECDVSIRPGWFWHAAQNDKVKAAADLTDLYFKSVGRNASFLLNVPPDRRGLLHETDVASLAGFGKYVGETFAKNLATGAKLKASNVRGKSSTFRADNLLDGKRDTCWATDDAERTPNIEITLPRATEFNVIRLREDIRLGHRVDEMTVESWADGAWKQIAQCTSVGSCRLLRLPQKVRTDRVRLNVAKAAASPALSEFGLFLEA